MVKTLVLLFALAPALACAQGYPDKPRLSELLGQPVVIAGEFAALVRADTARYAGIVKSIGLKID
jgi:hypothetical protein